MLTIDCIPSRFKLDLRAMSMNHHACTNWHQFFSFSLFALVFFSANWINNDYPPSEQINDPSNMAQNQLWTNGKSTLKTINSRSIEKLTSGNVNSIVAGRKWNKKKAARHGKEKNVRAINWRIYISVNSSSVIIFIIVVGRSENLLTAGWKVNQLHFLSSPLAVLFLGHWFQSRVICK